MDKLTSLIDIKCYYCSECKHYHIRKYKYIINSYGIRIKSKDTPFFNHKDFAYKLTQTELFTLSFNKSLEKYSIKKHKRTIGSRKQ